MIPKSVSGSTRIIALAAVLLIPAWGWAGDEYVTVEQGGQIWVIGKWINSEKEQCIEWTTLNGGKQVTCQPTCERRMREAMKDARMLLETRIRPTPHFMQKLDQTINDCVEGK